MTHLQAENLAALRALFPELITEGVDGVAVNLDVLKQLVGDKTVTDAEEKYGLNWHGKSRARQLALTPSTGTLRPCPEDSVDWDTTQNLMIEGDNLEVLKLLQKSYAGKVKLIYIDPPYNTGKNFVYPDNFQDSIKNYLELTGQVGEGGKKLSANPETSGRFHTNWLNMMYPRLKLTRNLLRDDGVVFISLDDSELSRMTLICDEIFGSENYVGCITVQGNPRGRDYGGIARMHDYLLVYEKSELAELRRLYDPNKEFPFQDEIGGFEIRELRNRNIAFNSANRPNLFYPFYLDPHSKDKDGFYQIGLAHYPGWIEVLPKESQGFQTVWRWGKDKSHRNLNAEIVGRDNQRGGFQIVEKYRSSTKMARSIWVDKDVNTEKGTLLVKELMGAKIFQFPKPVELIRRVIEMGTDLDSLVLDLFAGSGTTGHAVMAQNSADGGNRKYIVVQLPEPLRATDADQKPSADYCTSLGKPHNIAEITKERLRRAGKKIREENPLFAGDLGFRVFKLASSNIQAWEPDRDNLAGTLS